MGPGGSSFVGGLGLGVVDVFFCLQTNTLSSHPTSNIEESLQLLDSCRCGGGGLSMARIREPAAAACEFKFRVSCGDNVNSIKIRRGQGVSTSALISVCIFPLLLLFY